MLMGKLGCARAEFDCCCKIPCSCWLGKAGTLIYSMIFFFSSFFFFLSSSFFFLISELQLLWLFKLLLLELSDRFPFLTLKLALTFSSSSYLTGASPRAAKGLIAPPRLKERLKEFSLFSSPSICLMTWLRLTILSISALELTASEDLRFFTICCMCLGMISCAN